MLSRLKILRLERLQTAQIEAILQRALTDRVNGLGAERLTLEPAALHMLADVAQGDARSALNLLEQAALMVPEGETEITAASLQDILGTAFRRYDKKGDAHYDIVSAFIKSMRGSDPDAAIHYLARMLEGGEDLRFIARRLVICAAEDEGMADPQALVVANAAAQAADFVGLPEAQLLLSEAVLYVATAPKSNTATTAIAAARADVRRRDCGDVPDHLRDAHYGGAARLGHGTGYRYPHDYPHAWVDQQYLPDALRGTRYYHPKGEGYEARFRRDGDEGEN